MYRLRCIKIAYYRPTKKSLTKLLIYKVCYVTLNVVIFIEEIALKIIVMIRVLSSKLVVIIFMYVLFLFTILTVRLK